MSALPPPQWTALQQELLAAMGYTLWQQAPATAAGVAPAHAGYDQADQGHADDRRADDGGAAMRRALARAAAMRPELLPELPPLAALRGDPAAKRALWPRLRALRRKPG